MSFEESTRPTLSLSRDFISESTLESARAQREKEYRETHNGQAPADEAYDARPLAERLAEQRNKREEEFAEATKLSNLVHRLDSDEAAFLESQVRRASEKRKQVRQQEDSLVRLFKSEQDKFVEQVVLKNCNDDAMEVERHAKSACLRRLDGVIKLKDKARPVHVEDVVGQRTGGKQPAAVSQESPSRKRQKKKVEPFRPETGDDSCTASSSTKKAKQRNPGVDGGRHEASKLLLVDYGSSEDENN